MLNKFKSLLKGILKQDVEISKVQYISAQSTIYNTLIGDFSYVFGDTRITNTVIGKYCSIATNCVIGEADHPYRFLSTSPIFYQEDNVFGFKWATKDEIKVYDVTTIGNDVWIGANVFIKSGVTIGHGAVIAAGAIVVRDVEPYSIVGGVPSKVLKMRFSNELIELLLKVKWWDWEPELLKEKQQFFVNENEEELIRFLKEVLIK